MNFEHHCEEANDLVVNFRFSRPTITTLCGSTKFKHEYDMANRRLTLQGEVILTCGIFPHADGIILMDAEKRLMDQLHLTKIEMSDGIYVINVNNYIGESTRNEIEYAMQHGKTVRFLEPIQRSNSDRNDQPTFDFVGREYNGDTNDRDRVSSLTYAPKRAAR